MLALEPSFDLSALKVRPASLQLVGPEGSWQVEHKVMQLLVVLAKAEGAAVGRDEIVDVCWDGRIISEDALNRCVSRLRKALQADPRLAVEAVPKIGYRLKILEEAGAVAPKTNPNTVTQKPARSRWPWLLAGAVAGVALIAGGVALYTRVQPRPVTAVQSWQIMTSEAEGTIRPALSPDGATLIYSRGRSSLDLYMRSTRDGAPVRLTSDSGDEYSPAWSPKGDRIAFVKSDETGAPCRIMVMTIPGGAAREAGRCVIDPGTSLSWLDERTLVYADRTAPRTIRRIRTMDIETGATADLSRPREGLADQDPQVSPDGRSVLFRRIKSVGVDELIIHDVRRNAERPLINDGDGVYGLAWTRDSRQVVFSSNRGGDPGLWVADVNRRRAPQRLSVGLMAFGRISADAGDQIAVEIHNQRSRLEIALPDGLRSVDPAEAMDTDPDVNVRGSTAFISNRSGSPELWVAPDGGKAVRLTHRGGGAMYDVRWSPDGRKIAFIAVDGRNTDIYEIGADGSGLRRRTSDGKAKANVVWGADGLIRYIHDAADGSHVMRVEADGSSRPEPGGEGWQVMRSSPDGRLYGWRREDRRLWVLTPGDPTPREAIAGFRMQDPYWVIGRDGVYFLANAGRQAGLRFRPWSGPERELRRLDNVAWTSDVAIDPRDDSFVYANTGGEVRDIGLFKLTR